MKVNNTLLPKIHFAHIKTHPLALIKSLTTLASLKLYKARKVTETIREVTNNKKGN